MLTLCGCELTSVEMDTLISLLEADVTLASDEAAAALRFARDHEPSHQDLDGDIKRAIAHVLDEGHSGGLARLRAAITQGC